MTLYEDGSVWFEMFDLLSASPKGVFAPLNSLHDLIKRKRNLFMDSKGFNTNTLWVDESVQTGDEWFRIAIKYCTIYLKN